MIYTVFFIIFVSILNLSCNSALELRDSKRPPSPSGTIDQQGHTAGDPRIAVLVRTLAADYVGKDAIAGSLEKKFPSMVIGVVTPKSKQLYYFGVKPDGGVPNEKSIYPLSSISKMITGIILARGIAEGDFKIPYKARDLLPVQLSGFVGERTLGMLVSHYASYRAKPGNLDYSNRLAPAANYTMEQLAKCLADSNCSTTPSPIGSEYLYSDLGIGILGIALVNFYKASGYESLLKSRLTSDLGLTNTSSELGKFHDSNLLVPGFTQLDEQVSPATMGALVAAGGILSNGQDMLKLLEMIVYPSRQWQATMNIATTLVRPGIALAIDHLNRDALELYSKSGEQAGFSSIIMWNKVNQSGVFILGNRGMGSKSLAKLAISLNKSIIGIY